MSKILDANGALVDAPAVVDDWDGDSKVFVNKSGTGRTIADIKPPPGTKRYSLFASGYPGTPMLNVKGGGYSYIWNRIKHDGAVTWTNKIEQSAGTFRSLFFGDTYSHECHYNVRFDMVQRGTRNEWVGSVRGFCNMSTGVGSGFNDGGGSYFTLDGRLAIHVNGYIEWVQGLVGDANGPYIVHAVAYR